MVKCQGLISFPIDNFLSINYRALAKGDNNVSSGFLSDSNDIDQKTVL